MGLVRGATFLFRRCRLAGTQLLCPGHRIPAEMGGNRKVCGLRATDKTKTDLHSVIAFLFLNFFFLVQFLAVILRISFSFLFILFCNTITTGSNNIYIFLSTYYVLRMAMCSFKILPPLG